jgi:glycogen debranching enzyme
MTERRLSRPDCTDLEVAERREWLVTNGRGGYAMGTVAGTLTRRYHGLLIAALDPPVARRLVVPSVQFEVRYRGANYALATNRWASGVRAPQGWELIDAFAVRDGVPSWTYAVGDALVEVEIAMEYGADRTALALHVLRAAEPLTVTARVLVADRDHHGGPLPDPAEFDVHFDAGEGKIALPVSGHSVYVSAPGAVLTPACDRWSGFFAERESERGLDPLDDYVHALDAVFPLGPGARAGVVVGLTPGAAPAGAIVAAARARGVALGADAPRAIPGSATGAAIR